VDPKSIPFGQWATDTCAVQPTADAVQYASSRCKPVLFWFLRKWRYINISTFNL